MKRFNLSPWASIKSRALTLTLSLPLGQITTTTHDHSISPDICATPSMSCPSCHPRGWHECVCTHKCVCVWGVNLGPRREGGRRRQWPRKWCIPCESRRQQGGGLLPRGAQMWSIMFIKSNDQGLVCFFFVKAAAKWFSFPRTFKAFKKPLMCMLCKQRCS